MTQDMLFQDVIPAPDMVALEAASQAQYITLDIETSNKWTGIGPEKKLGLSYPAQIIVVTLAWREGDEIHLTTIAGKHLDDPAVKAALIRIYESVPIIGAHNAVFDLRGMGRYVDGRVPVAVWDTFTMQRLLAPQAGVRYGLIDVAQQLGLSTPADQAAMKGKRLDLDKMAYEDVARYCAQDTVLTLQVMETQWTLIKDERTAELAQWECRAMLEYVRMTVRGVVLNTPHVKQRLIELSATLTELRSGLAADGLHDPNSPDQRRKYLYEVKRLPFPEWSVSSIFFTKGGHTRLGELKQSQGQVTPDDVRIKDLSISAKVLNALIQAVQLDEYAGDDSEEEELSAEDQEYAAGLAIADGLRLLMHYLLVDRMVATLESLLDHAGTDGRIHSLISIGTDTGRRSSGHPNVQNFKMALKMDGDPSGDMAGVLIGDDGFTLVGIDYSGAENWLAAMVATDSALARACATKDFHSTMASSYFPAAWQFAESNLDERKRLRKISKNVTFARAYGAGVGKLSVMTGQPRDQIKRMLQSFDQDYPQLAKAREVASSRVGSGNGITLWTGRKLALPKQAAFKAWNYACQGGVAEITKRAMVEIGEQFRARGLRSRVALEVHDELVLEVAHDEWDESTLR